MNYDVESAVALLVRTPAALRALLQELPPQWLDAAEGPGAWSVRDVACHLADLESDAWLPRARFILEHGCASPLPAIERERFRDRYADAPLDIVLDDFAQLRTDNLSALRSIPLDDTTLRLTGHHGTLGAVTLEQLLSTWAVHDLTHLAQIARALAAQYRDAVGPWAAFLSVLAPRAAAASRPAPGPAASAGAG
jgi:hypothetical protein